MCVCALKGYYTRGVRISQASREHERLGRSVGGFYRIHLFMMVEIASMLLHPWGFLRLLPNALVLQRACAKQCGSRGVLRSSGPTALTAPSHDWLGDPIGDLGGQP